MPIAAIYHAAQLLAAAGVVRGKRISAYPACAAEVKLPGAEYAQIKVCRPRRSGCQQPASR